MRILWSPLALERATEISLYIAKDSPKNAKKWVNLIFKEVKHLEIFPKTGRKVPETKRHDLRELLFGHYRIIYKTEKNKILILTIRHGKQLLPLGEVL